MAKQDLVVKLLLDSGAFGTKIKEAERKAKEFSDNMKNAGQSAGNLGKELGVSIGAFGKLGGALTGAGGVIAAFGAFKSIMESTHTSSKTFKSTIEGFEGVFTSLQQSIASLDFSTLHGGLDEVFKRYKEYKELIMDAGLKGVAYNYLYGATENKFKKYEVEFKNPNTTDERREEIKKLVEEEFKSTERRLELYRDTVFKAMKTDIQRLDGKIKDMSNEMVSEVIRTALDNTLNEDEKKLDIEKYAKLTEKYKDLESKMTNYKNKYLSNLGTYNTDKSNTRALENSKKYKLLSEQAEAEFNAFINDIENQKVFFRNALYKKDEEKLTKLLEKALTIENSERAFYGMKNEYAGWTPPTKPTTTGGATPLMLVDENTVESIIPKSTVKGFSDRISAIKEARDKMLIDTPEFELATTQLQLYTKALQELQSTIASMDKTMILTPLQLPNSMSGSYNPKATLDTAIKKWRETYHPITKNFEDMNLAITSSISLLDSLSSAFSAVGTDSSRAIGGVIGVFSDLGQGIMDFIAIQQAASAAKGVSSAAGLPFPYNLAAITTVVSTIVSIFANIRSMTAGKFAEGGIVGGQSYSGDRLFAMVNSGEMILNKRQQANLSNMLGSGGRVEFHISGDSLVGVLTNKTNKNKLIR